MIDKVALSQYVRIDGSDASKSASASRKTSVTKETTETTASSQDQVAISSEAQRAEEVARYTAMAQESSAVDQEKIETLKAAVAKPNYLDGLAKTYAEDIAEKLVETIDSRYDYPTA